MRPSADARETDQHVLPIAGQGLIIRRAGRTLLSVPDISLDNQGLIAVVGPNGAGKSLLLKLLAGVISADRGSVTWSGRGPSRSGYRRLSLVLQAPVLLRRSALANVTYALKAAGFDNATARKAASDALDNAGLSGIAETPARLLSGGEKQRLALARALAIEPEIVLLDEPVANLDPASTLAIEKMIIAARERRVAVVLVTHDLAQARRLADEIIFMNRGQIVERGNAAAFFEKQQSEAAAAFVRGEIVT
ncbi:MAG: energy-coupling factor ABC transporter ATP-binding protein [Rhizobiaceae bacterium]